MADATADSILFQAGQRRQAAGGKAHKARTTAGLWSAAERIRRGDAISHAHLARFEWRTAVLVGVAGEAERWALRKPKRLRAANILSDARGSQWAPAPAPLFLAGSLPRPSQASLFLSTIVPSAVLTACCLDNRSAASVGTLGQRVQRPARHDAATGGDHGGSAAQHVAKDAAPSGETSCGRGIPTIARTLELKCWAVWDLQLGLSCRI